MRSRIDAKNLGVAQTLGESVDLLEVVGMDRDVLAREPGEAGQDADGVVVVVENGDFHGAFNTEQASDAACRTLDAQPAQRHGRF